MTGWCATRGGGWKEEAKLQTKIAKCIRICFQAQMDGVRHVASSAVEELMHKNRKAVQPLHVQKTVKVLRPSDDVAAPTFLTYGAGVSLLRNLLDSNMTSLGITVVVHQACLPESDSVQRIVSVSISRRCPKWLQVC